jgi:hypothetical protein
MVSLSFWKKNTESVMRTFRIETESFEKISYRCGLFLSMRNSRCSELQAVKQNTKAIPRTILNLSFIFVFCEQEGKPPTQEYRDILQRYFTIPQEDKAGQQYRNTDEGGFPMSKNPIYHFVF